VAVKIRLTRMGRHKRPFYRVVVTDSESPRDGRFIEIVGYYNPLPKTPEVKIKMDRVDYWRSRGAQVSATVRHLLDRRPPVPVAPVAPVVLDVAPA